mmetsp:Transcript_12643/g.29071  ORF Transcript_12643/g.29071 Transcript_12643/m.29071 type:complete len:372 (+) Transcript_12643:48-1163(+)
MTRHGLARLRLARGREGDRCKVDSLLDDHVDVVGAEVNDRGGASEAQAKGQTRLATGEAALHIVGNLVGRQGVIEHVEASQSSVGEGLARIEATTVAVLLLAEHKASGVADLEALLDRATAHFDTVVVRDVCTGVRPPGHSDVVPFTVCNAETHGGMRLADVQVEALRVIDEQLVIATGSRVGKHGTGILGRSLRPVHDRNLVRGGMVPGLDLDVALGASGKQCLLLLAGSGKAWHCQRGRHRGSRAISARGPLDARLATLALIAFGTRGSLGTANTISAGRAGRTRGTMAAMSPWGAIRTRRSRMSRRASGSRGTRHLLDLRNLFDNLLDFVVLLLLGICELLGELLVVLHQVGQLVANLLLAPLVWMAV